MRTIGEQCLSACAFPSTPRSTAPIVPAVEDRRAVPAPSPEVAAARSRMLDLVDEWVASAPRDLRALDDGQRELLSEAIAAQQAYASLKAAAQQARIEP
jgi:hypothetical protein